MNKVARFLLTGFVLSVITVILSLGFAQSSVRKAIRQDTVGRMAIVR